MPRPDYVITKVGYDEDHAYIQKAKRWEYDPNEGEVRNAEEVDRDELIEAVENDGEHYTAPRDGEGNLTEGATSNVFLVEEGTLKTPRTDGALLDGITRSVVLGLAANEEFPVETGTYTTADVREADEAFLTNTTWELRPIGRADGVAVGGGPVTRLLSRLFDERVERAHYE